MSVALRSLLVDHEDSFAYNLAHALGELAGEMPHVVSSRDLVVPVASDLHLVVLGPGPGHPRIPRDAGRSLELLDALPAGMPVLGVCFGLQLLVTAAGGAVGPAREIAHGKSLPVLHHGEGLFEGLPSPVSMMRYNSLVAQEPLPAQYRVTAWSEAGEIMALEHVTQPCWGVQFHPESVGSPEGLRLLANVVARVRQRSAAGA